MKTTNYNQLLGKMHNIFGLWEANVSKHSAGVKKLSHVLEFNAMESQCINSKLEYIMEQQKSSKKHEEKLKAKRVKL